MKADSGFQDNYSVVVASGTWFCFVHTPCPIISRLAKLYWSTTQCSFHQQKYLTLSVSHQV